MKYSLQLEVQITEDRKEGEEGESVVPLPHRSFITIITLSDCATVKKEEEKMKIHGEDAGGSN